MGSACKLWNGAGTGRGFSPGVQRTHGTYLLPCVGGCPPIPRHATHTLLAQVPELLEQMGDGATVAPPAVLDASAADATPRSPTGSPATAASAVPLRQLLPEPAPVLTPERVPGPTLECPNLVLWPGRRYPCSLRGRTRLRGGSIAASARWTSVGHSVPSATRYSCTLPRGTNRACSRHQPSLRRRS